MKGFLLLGAGAFLAGAATAAVMERRSRVDDEFGEDLNWPAVPYTSATHPDSPQERVTAPVEEAPPAMDQVSAENTAKSATSGSTSSSVADSY